MKPDEYTSIGGNQSNFQTTHWTAIEAVGSDGARNHLLLGNLLQTYWKPVYFYLRRRGYDNEEAKEAGKRLTATSVSEAERAVATTIYHAAIARCLVHHNKKITQHSYNKLDESFTLLIEKKWMAFELVELFTRARDICKKKRGKK